MELMTEGKHEPVTARCN